MKCLLPTQWVKKLWVILLLIFVFSLPAIACTGFIKKTTDGDVIYARTNEFAVDLHTKMLFIPRKTHFYGSLPNGRKGMQWTTQYAMMGVGMFDKTDILDGINEKGLGFGAFYFPGYAKYANFDRGNTQHDMAPWEFGNWMLGNFATINQVKAALANVRIVNTPLAELHNSKFPLHFFIFDKTGKAIVIEPLDGKLKVYDDPVGAITNSPPFTWHLINLNNYINLSASNVANHKLTNMKLFQTGQGSGMLGLPGDFTPPSRFIRIVALSASAFPVKTAQQGVSLAWNIIDNVNIPKGATRDITPDNKMYLNYTQDVGVYDTRNLRIYFRNYNNPVIRMVDMKKLNMNGHKILRFTLFQPPKYVDLTNRLKPISR